MNGMHGINPPAAPDDTIVHMLRDLHEEQLREELSRSNPAFTQDEVLRAAAAGQLRQEWTEWTYAYAYGRTERHQWFVNWNLWQLSGRPFNRFLLATTNEGLVRGRVTGVTFEGDTAHVRGQGHHIRRRNAGEAEGLPVTFSGILTQDEMGRGIAAWSTELADGYRFWDAPPERSVVFVRGAIEGSKSLSISGHLR